MDETLLQISKLDFCIQDVTLYLDTHPHCKEALDYYHEGIKHLKVMKQKYPALTNRDGRNIEKYIHEPFPWMKGDCLCGSMKNVCNTL